MTLKGSIISKKIRTVPSFYCSNIESLKNIKNVPTHELLSRLNFINYPKAGLVNWLPMGNTMVQKLSNVIRTHMNNIGFEETSLTLLSSSELWKKTNRWNNTEIFKLTDSSKSEFCLVPTAEEEVTSLVAKQVNSPKNLPVLYYQINTKFRDEKRPRSGLLRGKQFIMKDGYSFDLDESNAMNTYKLVTDAYVNIFTDLKLPFVKADADTGEIGGSLSHEWHYVHHTGEDSLFSCDSCGSISNVEKTLSYSNTAEDIQDVTVRYFMTKDKSTLVCAYYPTSRELQENFIKNEVSDIDLSISDQEAILKEFSDEETLITKRIVRIMDARLTSRSNFPDFPIKFINRSLITTLTDVPIVSAIEGEICGKCDDGALSLKRAIEVGHTFYLGDKYSSNLDCTVDTYLPDGKAEKKNIMMGCYGIGISRIIAAIGEINKDERGLRWPSAISPWDVTVIEANSLETQPLEVYDLLESSQIEYRLDNRQKIGIGKKVNHSHLIGIPLVVILGKKFPIVEIEVRGSRFSDDMAWKKLYDEKDFHWEVDYNDEGVDVKHYVHIDGFTKVIKSLLENM